ACLARLGEYRPYALCDVVSEETIPESRGVELSNARDSARRRIFDPSACFLIADILSDDSARALAFGVESNLRFDFPVACKTGTSSDFRDNWAFGYTP